jgi:hypothetical protein
MMIEFMTQLVTPETQMVCNGESDNGCNDQEEDNRHEGMRSQTINKHVAKYRIISHFKKHFVTCKVPNLTLLNCMLGVHLKSFLLYEVLQLL